MATRSIIINAKGLKPLTTHEVRVGDVVVPVANIQVSGSRKGEGQVTTDARGQIRITIFLDTNDGVSKRVVTLTAPFSRAAAEFTF